jgi:hypothetical protein
MDNQEFITIVKEASKQENLPLALEYLKTVNDIDVKNAALALVGQFALAEIEGEQRIYHVSLELNDDGVEEEYVEHIMNEGDETIVFVAWFFDSQFSIKRKDVYQAADRTYKQPKRT